MFFISQQLDLFVLRIIIENTKQKCDFNISNLTNSDLLTIEKHYTLTGSSAFLYFKVSKTRNIDVANTEMHHQPEKALDLQGLSANF
jgi:hypothetical protein